MDYAGEIIALGIDVFILGTCLRSYLKKKNSVTMIQGAPFLEINKQLNELVETHPDHKLTYVAVRGTVKPIGNPIISNANPKIKGVVQLFSIKEHVVQRGAMGAWAEHERPIQEVHNVMPFVLENRGCQVEVVDPLAAEILDMDVISDVFKPSQPSVFDHIFGFFYGIRRRGIQETEKMLRKDVVITGIGELVVAKDGKGLRLQPPDNGAPFYLTTMSVNSLIKKLEDSRGNYRIGCYIFGTIALVIGGLIVRRYWREKKRTIEAQKRKEELEIQRKERRKRNRDQEIPENQLCVVCRSNPREMILLPCGHVCLCEDCADGISDFCPICRSSIERKAAAYIS